MRTPDTCEVIEWRGLEVTVREWCDPCDHPWDGDEPLPENAEGWDLLCRVEVTAYGHTFYASDSLGSNWIEPNPEGIRYLKETAAEVRAQALADLAGVIGTEASEAPIQRAQLRQSAARGLLSRLQPPPEKAEAMS